MTLQPQPQQERSRRALHRIYKAAAALLGTKTFDEITVKEVALQASVSVGTIYQRFETKDALLWSLYSHYISEAEVKIDQLVANPIGLRVDKRILQLVHLTRDLFSEWRGVIRSMDLRRKSASQAISVEDMKRIETVYKKMACFLVSENAKERDRDAAKLAISTLLSLSREHYIYGTSQPSELRFYKNESEFSDLLAIAVNAVFRGHVGQ